MKVLWHWCIHLYIYFFICLYNHFLISHIWYTQTSWSAHADISKRVTLYSLSSALEIHIVTEILDILANIYVILSDIYATFSDMYLTFLDIYVTFSDIHILKKISSLFTEIWYFPRSPWYFPRKVIILSQKSMLLFQKSMSHSSCDLIPDKDWLLFYTINCTALGG